MNTYGDYHCDCQEGYKIDESDPSNSTCIIGDPCFEVDCSWLRNGMCYKGECLCDHGFNSITLHTQIGEIDSENFEENIQKICVDIDECTLATKNKISLCDTEISTCVNFEGGYRCDCFENFKHRPGSGELECIDVDECSDFKFNSTELIHNCHQKCDNFDGNFACSCFEGFEFSQDGVTCIDINECDLTRFNSCPKNSTCVNSEGSYECVCDEGFEMNPDKQCVDINECLNPNSCAQMCQNTEGSFICSCTDGFIVNSTNSTLCDDIDECSNEKLNFCQEFETCKNTIPFYECSCKSGFIVVESNSTEHIEWSSPEPRCLDIDECSKQTDLCNGKNEACYNTPGSYNCDCAKGYKYFRMTETCEDLDECAVEPFRCGKDATCVNEVGSFRCEGCFPSCSNSTYCSTIKTNEWRCNCKEGYIDLNSIENGEKANCQDIDECSLRNDLCSPSQECRNLPGSYECGCPEFFEPQSSDFPNVCVLIPCIEGYDRLNKDQGDLKCYNIDECNTEDNIDDALCSGQLLTECRDTDGGYECACIFGYEKDPSQNNTCVDINECEQEISPCHPTEKCINLEIAKSPAGRGFDCECPEHWIPEVVFDFESVAGGSPKIFTSCKECKTGTFADKTINKCVDIDECAQTWDGEQNGHGEGICHSSATCQNTYGAYECLCSDGKELANSTVIDSKCVDINECENGNNNCDNYSQDCFNTEGWYTCTCKSGFDMILETRFNNELNSTESIETCVDVDECSSVDLNNCQAQTSAYCRNLPGSYESGTCLVSQLTKNDYFFDSVIPTDSMKVSDF